MRQFGAVIIGLGRIGQGFDYDQQNDSVIATHAAAYARHPGFALLAAVDPVAVQRERFTAKFKRPAYADVAAMMKEHKPEVFSIAVPVEQHCSTFQEVIQYNPRAIICEKPIAVSVSDGRLMESVAKQHACVLAVNYMRRFEPGSIALRTMIRQKELGSIFKGTVWYSKGIYNNASHFIDLLCFWLGDLSRVEILSRGRKWNDIDPEPDFCLYFGTTPIYFLAGREECYSLGEINLFATAGVIRYVESGNRIMINRTRSSTEFPEYTILNRDSESIPTDLKRYQWHVLEGVYNHILNGSALNSNSESAIKTLEIVEKTVTLLQEKS